jgi:anti-anti-sigma factor
MEIVHKQHQQWLEVRIAGRLNAQWADSLERELADAVRRGARQIYLEMSGITFLSSAGIRILLKYRKELASLQGSLLILSPSEPVARVLELSGLLVLFAAEKPAIDSHDQESVATGGAGEALVEGGSVSVFPVSPGAVMSLRTMGDPRQLEEGAFLESYRVPLPGDAIAVGLGGFGDGFADCREQFGEFMSLGGSAIALPTDGGHTPDFLTHVGDFVPGVQALYAIVCQGRFADFFTFSSDSAADPIPFSRLVAAALSICTADCIALAMIAETDGLVGASLLRSPALSDGIPLLDFPGVRDRLALTSEPQWPHSLALVCGVALQREEPRLAPFVRPLGEGGLAGHFHAAALSYRALPGGVLELAPTVAGLMQTQNLMGLTHLLNDTRPIAGIGESCFLRGAVWCGPAEMGEVTP